MNKYSFQVNWSVEDQGFVATSPEFEGVSGFGATRTEAFEEAQISLELALETYKEEGWALPAPRERAEYSGQFRQRIPRSMHRRLAQRAEEEGVSQNTLVTTFIEKGLRDQEVSELLQGEVRDIRSLASRRAHPTVAAAVKTTGPAASAIRGTAANRQRGH